MAAEIKPVEQSTSENNTWKSIFRRLELLSKIDGVPLHFNQALMIGDKCQGVLGACDDKSLRVWLLNNRNTYSCLVNQFVPANASSLCFNKEVSKIYVGLGNGTIMEYLLSDDFKHVRHVRDVLAHVDRVNCMHLSTACQWLLSGSRDRYLHWYCTETGNKVDSYFIDAWVTCLEFDSASLCAFIGDISGQITVLKLSKNTTALVLTCLKGHSESVRSLAWDPAKNMLFSGGGDNMVVVWDIGGKKGTAFELSYHQDNVEAVSFIGSHGQLISAGFDSMIVVWNMEAQRKQIVEWNESDKCEICGNPFFWNVRMMWDIRSLGGRQHHCRRCGRAVCAKCSPGTSNLPEYGFETPVRLCTQCLNTLTPDELVPLSMNYNSKHKVTFMHVNPQHKRLLTVGKDNVIKIWQMVENKNDKF